MLINKFIAPLVCWTLIISISFLNAQSLDDLNFVTTLQPDLELGNQLNNKNSTSISSSTTSSTSSLISSSTTSSISSSTFSSTTTLSSILSRGGEPIDLNADASNHFIDGQCKNDTHCEQPNQFCKLDNNQTDLGHCECSIGFVGESCNQISDCSMCTNRSKCKNVNNTLSCLCKSGYYGTTCEKNHCGVCVHGICIHDEFSEQYECFCMNGYTGNGCTEDYNDCLGNTKCQNNGTCVDQVAGFVCNCPTGFKGKFCEQDIDECSLSPCKNGDKCTNTFGSYNCECLSGFTGLNCEENIDDCASTPCLNNGKCIDKIDGFECNCTDTGFNGTNCEKNINDCFHNPCINGICEDLIKDFQCHCSKGFKGKLCEEEIFECDSKPCKNGAVCIEKTNSTLMDEMIASNLTSNDIPYFCKCSPGWTGINCEININDCLNVNCNNGTCIDQIGSYKCKCERGFSGKHCEQDINMCELNNPCKNHGKCVDGTGSDYYCDCSNTGFKGVDCSLNINECEENSPCQHNGTCIDHSPYYECICLNGYKGIHCEEDINECSSSPCRNGGICYEKSDSKLYGFHKNLPFNGLEFSYSNASGYICKCPAGIMGANCDFNINECQNVNCHNGTCKDGINEYRCLCYPGFEGDHCETEINECESSPCLNGGRCRNKIGDFECICPMYTSGKLCEDVFTGCETNICLNNGTCLQHPKNKENSICSCLVGFEGEYCQNSTSAGNIDLLFLLVISSGCCAIVLFLICFFVFIRRIKKARATRGTYSPSTQEMFGNSAGEILKPPPEERLI